MLGKSTSPISSQRRAERSGAGGWVGTWSKEVSRASCEGKSTTFKHQQHVGWHQAGRAAFASSACGHSCAVSRGYPNPDGNARRLPEIAARCLTSSFSFHSPLPLWLLTKTGISQDISKRFVALTEGRFPKAQMGDGISSPLATNTQAFPSMGGRMCNPPASPRSGAASRPCGQPICWHFPKNP